MVICALAALGADRQRHMVDSLSVRCINYKFKLPIEFLQLEFYSTPFVACMHDSATFLSTSFLPSEESFLSCSSEAFVQVRLLFQNG